MFSLPKHCSKDSISLSNVLVKVSYLNEIKYKRINYSYTKKRVNKLIKELNNSISYDEFVKIVKIKLFH